METRVAVLEEKLRQHQEDDNRVHDSIIDMDKRLRTIERLTYIGIGGLIILAGVVGLVGTRILNLLSHG